MNNDLIKVKEEQHLYRDSIGAIHNMDNDGYRQFIMQRNLKQEESERMNVLENEVSEIKNTLNIILNILKENR